MIAAFGPEDLKSPGKCYHYHHCHACHLPSQIKALAYRTWQMCLFSKSFILYEHTYIFLKLFSLVIVYSVRLSIFLTREKQEISEEIYLLYVSC